MSIISILDQIRERRSKCTPAGPKCPMKMYLFSPDQHHIVLQIRETGLWAEQADLNYDYYHSAISTEAKLEAALRAAIDSFIEIQCYAGPHTMQPTSEARIASLTILNIEKILGDEI